MRVFQNLFAYGAPGIVDLSTCSSCYGPVPALGFGHAVLWKGGTSTDLFDLCNRTAPLVAQKEAMTA